MAGLDGDDPAADTGRDSGTNAVVSESPGIGGKADGGRTDLEGGQADELGEPPAASTPVANGSGGTEELNEAKKTKKEKLPSVSFIRLFSFADKYDYFLMLFGSLGAAAHGFALPVFLYIFGKILNGLGKGVTGSIASDEINKFAFYFVYLGLVTLGSAWIEVSLWMQTGERQSARLRKKYLAALLRQDVPFFDTDTNTGDFVFSIASDPLMVQDAIGEKMGNYIHSVTKFIGGLAVGFATQWRIATMTIAVIPFIAIAGAAYAYALTRTTAKAAIAYAEAGTIAEQAVAQVRTLYSFVSESKFINAYSSSLERTARLGYRTGLAKGLGMGVTFAIVYPSFAFLLWYGGVLVRQGILSGGQAVCAVYAIVLGGAALGQSMPILASFAKGKVAAYKIFQMIDHDSNINVVDKDAETLKAVEGHIEFCNVDFVYPSRPAVPILSGFNLDIPSGKTLAIVGSSGSGKSTVVSLIERFYDPTEGAVLLDGHDIKHLSLKWLRGQIGLVNQEPALFATTIAANISYGKDNTTQDEIEEAAASANAHSFIVKLPLGYLTHVGERGTQLSGGQKQRVAIARAMLRNPAILLLDEATSALDAGSELIVQDALDDLMVGRTTVVVAHRLSTIKNADSIAVVQQGQIVERGTHSELISMQDGVYSALVRLQELAVSTDDPDRPELSASILSESGRRSQSRASWSLRRSFDSLIVASVSLRRTRSMNAEEPRDQIESEVEVKGSFTRLMAMSKPEWKFGVGGILGSILAGCQTPAYGFIIGDVLTAYYEPPNKMKTGVEFYAFILAAIGAASVFISVLQHYCVGVLGENLVKRVRERMFGTILRNELGWFDRVENNSSQILARLDSDATNVRAAIGDRIAVILQNSVLIVVAWIVSIILQWKLALVIISTTPLLVLSFASMRFFLKGFSGDLSKAYARASQVAGEAVTNIRTVAAFNIEDKIQALFVEELKVPATKSFVTGQAAGFGLGLAQCLMFTNGLGLWYAGQAMANDGASFGNAIKVFIILIISSVSMAETLALAPDIVKGGKAVESVFLVLDRETVIEPDNPEGEQAGKLRGYIEFKDVTFAYPSRPDVVIFKSLNLRVRSGHCLCACGSQRLGQEFSGCSD